MHFAMFCTFGDHFVLDISAYADILVCVKATAQIFKSLGDETRLRIMALLVKGREELCVCDIMAALNLPQSTVSRHLSYLKNAGLVDDRRQGIWMYYRINKAGVRHAADLFDLLAAILFETEQTAQDRYRLEEHLVTKGKNVCG